MEHSTTDPKLESWISVAKDSDFPIQNLPYGVFRRKSKQTAIGVAIGDQILDLSILYSDGLLREVFPMQENNIFRRPYLNDFMVLGNSIWSRTRQRISELLTKDCPIVRDNENLRERALLPQDEAEMLLPIKVKNFVDFYSCMEHATNVGKMFRDPENALLPNWKHLPVGYNGRASSVIVSGQDITRPHGQTKADGQDPSFGPSKLLDIELEMGMITGMATNLGQPVTIGETPKYIFGMVLLNDWSARDVQKWEYVPLGPFLGKSFATSISPWVVPFEALEPFRVPGPKQEPPVLPHLQIEGDWNYDIHLEAHLQSNKMAAPMCITKTNFRSMYWNMQQQLAHLTSNGTNLEVGDLYGSGTVSGTERDSLGSMLELCWKGTRPLKLPNGEERKFLQDGDTVILKGWCQGDGYRVGFGECKAKVLPASS